MALFACKVGGTEGTTKVTKVGTINGTGTLNVTSYDGYQNLTIANFLVAVKSGTTTVTYTTYGMHGTNTAGGNAIGLSYNHSTGILSSNLPVDSAWMVSVGAIYFDVYIVEGQIN